jgi:hypothetical protein
MPLLQAWFREAAALLVLTIVTVGHVTTQEHNRGAFAVAYIWASMLLAVVFPAVQAPLKGHVTTLEQVTAVQRCCETVS